jgi:hypothetical protein
MAKTAQLADHPERALLSEAQHLLVWLIDTLHGLLGAAGARPAARDLRRWVRDYLAPAEGAMRRALRLLAATLAPVPVRTQTTSPPPPAGSPASRPSRRPAFRLFEPAPRKGSLPLAERPHVSVAGEALPPIPAARHPVDEAAVHLRFLRRLEALELAFEDPLRQARRLARRRRPDRRLTLAYTAPPGARARSLAGDAADLLRRLNHAALQAELSPDSS